MGGEQPRGLPVAVIGAGPVGLAAAAHAVQRGVRPLVLEAGGAVGASVREWGHVRVFSPWAYNIDPVAEQLLQGAGWQTPTAGEYPTGAELVDRYLEPLAALPQIGPHIRLRHRVTAITRLGLDKVKTPGREDRPFVLRVLTPDGELDVLAVAVIDASGTWRQPNPLGGAGVPALGEQTAVERINYGIPDVLGVHRARYAGQRVLVVGAGHSALNVLHDLAILKEAEPDTRIVWALRREPDERVFGGGSRDQLPERARLGDRVAGLLDAGVVEQVTGFRTTSVRLTSTGVMVADGGRRLDEVDEIVAATGFRPDLEVTRELRLDLDDVVESPAKLAPLIDPNVHSCGTVPPHGVAELAHPEPGFYVVGMKSYGRAPTFLLRTGYEQVRSVVAELAGDHAAAAQVQFQLPGTGVCSTAVGAEPEQEAPVANEGELAVCCG
jgi:thioredoxin reductase